MGSTSHVTLACDDNRYPIEQPMHLRIIKYNEYTNINTEGLGVHVQHHETTCFIRSGSGESTT
jgi:hypothetical protein